MNRVGAMNLWGDLEQEQIVVDGDEIDRGYSEPMFEVRLDALTEENQDTGRVQRTWRVRVIFGRSGWLHGAATVPAMDVILSRIKARIGDEEAEVAFENNAIVIT